MVLIKTHQPYSGWGKSKQRERKKEREKERDLTVFNSEFLVHL